jgi:hypothetical protein
VRNAVLQTRYYRRRARYLQRAGVQVHAARGITIRERRGIYNERECICTQREISKDGDAVLQCGSGAVFTTRESACARSTRSRTTGTRYYNTVAARYLQRVGVHVHVLQKTETRYYNTGGAICTTSGSACDFTEDGNAVLQYGRRGMYNERERIWFYRRRKRGITIRAAR